MNRWQKGWETRRRKEREAFQAKLIPKNWRWLWFVGATEKLSQMLDKHMDKLQEGFYTQYPLLKHLRKGK